ncbi:hypothetical protein L21_0580 [Methanoculleus chikugoensis]|jgi:hypothetical protein|uniref:Uncharacterized protein n=1 Tax=Methanoculleus chikugoensis TaxID=118126 RepID=A0A1M4MIK6_9EURY|nr:hypothetical protein [Methanoculleus chikugoensis]MDD4566470.1 hypothetical protein [Methanoculleus chikugoensis]SCL74697.1 hypothetical protein L21_0580 [Methanoculleus chikugoensis]
MNEKQFINGTGRGGLICIALLLFILAGSGIACASPGGEPQADAGKGREAVLGEPADTTTYQGSGSAFSIFYNPVHLACALGAVIVLAVGYVLIRRSRGKDAP